MTPKKSRKSLNDSLATEFVFGTQQATSEKNEIKNEPAVIEPTAEPLSSVSPRKKSRIMDKLMDSPEKEPTVRFTVDMAESMHRKLSILAAKTGKKKAEIVRMLLDEALEDIEV
jgi:hypothetical protein